MASQTLLEEKEKGTVAFLNLEVNCTANRANQAKSKLVQHICVQVKPAYLVSVSKTSLKMSFLTKLGQTGQNGVHVQQHAAEEPAATIGCAFSQRMDMIST